MPSDFRWHSFLVSAGYLPDTDIIHYTTNFYGWTRPVKAKMARDTCDTLHLSEEYPSFESFSNAEGNIYKTICEFEVSLRRMKDE